MRAMLRPEPQECVQPSVPWPVFRYRLGSFERPMMGTLLGVAGRRPVQNCACCVSPAPGKSSSTRRTMASQRTRFRSRS